MNGPLNALLSSSPEAQATAMETMDVEELADLHVMLKELRKDMGDLKTVVDRELANRSKASSTPGQMDLGPLRILVSSSKSWKGLDHPGLVRGVAQAMGITGVDRLPDLFTAKTTKTAAKIHGLDLSEYLKDEPGAGFTWSTSVRHEIREDDDEGAQQS